MFIIRYNMISVHSFHVGFVNSYSKISYGTNKKRHPLKHAKLLTGENVIVPISKKNDRGLIYIVIQITAIDKNIVGAIQEVIGEVGQTDIERMYLSRAATIDWSRQTKSLSSVKEINIDDKIIENIHMRSDFKDKNIMSIDPTGCYDIDDAMHIEYTDMGYTVYIHIADVSHYIEYGSDLDRETDKRASSCYLAHHQIDMLPKELVNQCSLFVDKERLAVTFVVEFDKQYNICNRDFVKSIIVNKRNYSYDVAEKEIHLNKDLNMLYNIAKKYNKNTYYDIHKMVEVYMVMANSYAAKVINDVNTNVVPIRYCGNRLLKTDSIIQKKIDLFGMSSAKYKIGYDNKRHEALDEDIYTHFTSPIRRYFDIVVHRYITDIIHRKHIEYVVDVDAINNKNAYYKRLERESKTLEIANKLHTEDSKYSRVHTGHVVGLSSNRVFMYIPEIDLDCQSKLFSNKLKYIEITEKDGSTEYYNRHTNVQQTIKIGDVVDVIIVVTMLSPKSKLIVKLLNNTLV